MSDLLVVGVGNQMRGDDAVGLAVARRVAGRGLDGVTVVESDGEPATLLAAWEGAAAVVIVDAVSSGATPGTVLRFDAADGPVPAACFRHSTHLFGVAEAIELARVLRKLPPRVIVIGVEGASWEPQEGMSPAVADAVPWGGATVLDELGVAHA